MPLEIHGFEIIDHSRNSWEKDSAYEIRDFEDDRLNFFCECFNVAQGTVCVNPDGEHKGRFETTEKVCKT